MGTGAIAIGGATTTIGGATTIGGSGTIAVAATGADRRLWVLPGVRGTATDLLVIWVLWLDYRRFGERRLRERCATQISPSAQTG